MIYPLKMVMFYSYVGLPEGIFLARLTLYELASSRRQKSSLPIGDDPNLRMLRTSTTSCPPFIFKLISW